MRINSWTRYGDGSFKMQTIALETNYSEWQRSVGSVYISKDIKVKEPNVLIIYNGSSRYNETINVSMKHEQVDSARRHLMDGRSFVCNFFSVFLHFSGNRLEILKKKLH